MTAEELPEGYETLEEVVAAAWAKGAAIDLTGVTYGRPHWEGQAPKAPFAYYRFLAGLVRHTGAARIFEIGTHQGGSTLAMARGLVPGAPAHLLTIDVEFENIEALSREPRIQRFKGEALQQDVITAVAKAFHHLPIDLLYIDADHRFFPSLAMVSIYAQLLKPRFVVLDDITLYDDMHAMWQVLQQCHPGEALDVTQLIPEMPANMPTATQGFGIIRLR